MRQIHSRMCLTSIACRALEGEDVAGLALRLYPEQAHFDFALGTEQQRFNHGRIAHAFTFGQAFGNGNGNARAAATAAGAASIGQAWRW
ncbi:MAG TPA: hypothetical protein VFW22_15715 [Pseudolabrys sp.]|nr:hypothetical protein [Pseudolabrys sp.]